MLNHADAVTPVVGRLEETLHAVDVGFSFMATQRLSLAWEKRQQLNLNNWIRRLRKAILGVTLTMAENHWPDILKVLYKLLYGP